MHSSTFAAGAMGSVAAMIAAGAAIGSLDPVSTILIVNPDSRESLQVANYYKAARGIPDANVIYLRPPADFATFSAAHRLALLGELANRGLSGHIDAALVMPGDPFFIDAEGYVSDGCSPVRRFSYGSAWTLSFVADEIVQGVGVSMPNGYYARSNSAIAFDGSASWLDGVPSDDPEARRYLIGAMLGYEGTNGNSIEEIIALIDRSVAADGTRPGGTFYYMETNDPARSDPRDGAFDAAVQAIVDLGGMAEHRCCSALPSNVHDILGIMTGAASLDLNGANLTILPGAFCDHLTSWAATFDNGSQTKVSEWIRHGASGSYGTVEEPCNYAGKFPHARLHVFYYQGLSLGESTFRSLAWTPFQGLIYGDPLTRPFAHVPEVDVPNLPDDAISGRIEIRPIARTTHPDATIDRIEVFLDGVPLGTSTRRTFGIDSRRHDDGFHELRVVAYDDTPVQTPGEWVGQVEFDNHPEHALLDVNRTTGRLSDGFRFSPEGMGGTVAQARLFHNGRIVGASPGTPFSVYGATFGPGASTVYAEIEFAGGAVVRTEPLNIEVSDERGTPSLPSPIAYSYRRRILNNEPALVHLPATFDDADVALTYEIVSPPAQATLVLGIDGPNRLLIPNPGASGTDTMTFRARAGSSSSGVATVTIDYGGSCLAGRPFLEVGPLRAGEIGQFRVTCAYPRDKVYLAYSLRGNSGQYVPPLNVTLDLTDPREVAPPQRADAEGKARWAVRIPGDLNTPRIVWFQATQYANPSNVVLTQIN